MSHSHFKCSYLEECEMILLRIFSPRRSCAGDDNAMVARAKLLLEIRSLCSSIQLEYMVLTASLMKVLAVKEAFLETVKPSKSFCSGCFEMSKSIQSSCQGVIALNKGESLPIIFNDFGYRSMSHSHFKCSYLEECGMILLRIFSPRSCVGMAMLWLLVLGFFLRFVLLTTYISGMFLHRYLALLSCFCKIRSLCSSIKLEYMVLTASLMKVLAVKEAFLETLIF
nr:PREDICTED: uncharacterized protein LOC108197074 isoform X2 [Daucus carota subsp. sativus]